MDNLDQVPEFAEACSKGHRLFGRVKYCPFCGVAVVQPDAATKQAGTPSALPVAEPQKSETAVPTPQPALQPEIKAPAPESARAVQPPIPEPVNVPVPEPEQPAQPGTKQQPPIPPAPQPPLESPKPEPRTPLPPLLMAEKKSFPKWVMAAGGLIAILILIQMFGGGKTEAPELPAATMPSADSTPVPTPKPPKKSLLKKSPEPSSAAEQPAPDYPPETEARVKQKPEPAPSVSTTPREDCPAGEISSKTRSMISDRNWGGASQFINRQLDQIPACSSNKELLMLQDMALELKKYMRDKNPRSARSGFDSLIDKYGNKSDLTKMRGLFDDALNKENDCAASGRTWDPAGFACN